MMIERIKARNLSSFVIGCSARFQIEPVKKHQNRTFWKIVKSPISCKLLQNKGQEPSPSRHQESGAHSAHRNTPRTQSKLFVCRAIACHITSHHTTPHHTIFSAPQIRSYSIKIFSVCCKGSQPTPPAATHTHRITSSLLDKVEECVHGRHGVSLHIGRGGLPGQQAHPRGVAADHWHEAVLDRLCGVGRVDGLGEGQTAEQLRVTVKRRSKLM